MPQIHCQNNYNFSEASYKPCGTMPTTSKYVTSYLNQLPPGVSRSVSVVAWLFAFVLIWHALYFYGLPIEMLCAVFGLIVVAILFYRLADAWVLALSIIIVTAVLELCLWTTGLGTQMFYRPTEMLRIGSDDYGYVYQPNRQMTMHSPYSDLEATHRVGILEPRDIEFVTDSLGFRNRTDYAGQALFLVGDSYAMGEGATQACMVTEVLKNTYHKDVYNLAHSGNQPHDYVKHINTFSKMHQQRPRAIVMFFEGNDFETFEPHLYPQMVTRPYQDFFKRSNVYRYTRWLYLRAMKPKDTGEGPVIKTVKGVPMAFSSWYVGNVLREEALQDRYLHLSEFFKRLEGTVAQIIFVPDKYRVYAPLLDQPPATPLPNRNWEYLSALAQQHQIPALNLYPALSTAAKQALERNEYLYWRGDTHWNCLGMEVAAGVISRALNLP